MPSESERPKINISPEELRKRRRESLDWAITDIPITPDEDDDPPTEQDVSRYPEKWDDPPTEQNVLARSRALLDKESE